MTPRSWRAGDGSRQSRTVGRVAQGVAVGGDDPPGVAVAGCQVAVRVGHGVRGDDVKPGGQVPGSNAAQDRVDVAGDARADDGLGQVDRRGDGGVGTDPGVQQLVGTEAQDVEDRRVELVERAVAARGKDGVVAALAAQRAVGELGRERGVAAGELAFRQQLGQQQVGVGLAVADRREDVVGGTARVGGARALGQAGASSCLALVPGPLVLPDAP